ncbi:hypothetical protein Esi_0483_0014 [Ectocarpus siliculosus]|uniref:Uncharacterized protein n=1 Tax=Ectocarpus siliculosus TaxID=2880 RepID=D7G2T2_ECTSI|nr:hypothetical protein Esi_0483_0014 [Ectocarpus siliculosus]|eukprot:CBJ33436.1 hypothetical protein Esi_0483_0014 [Ectocarpus siliculosus]
MTRALQDVEDALADALQGIGGWEPFHQGGEDFAGGGGGGGGGGGDDDCRSEGRGRGIGAYAASEGRRRGGGEEEGPERCWFSRRPAAAAGEGGRAALRSPGRSTAVAAATAMGEAPRTPTTPTPGGRGGGGGGGGGVSVSFSDGSVLPVGSCRRYGRGEGGGGAVPAGSAVDAAAMVARLERVLSRIMRRVDGARGLRAWVTGKVENAGGDAMEGLREIRGRWEAELGRLQAAERKLVRLQEQAKYGGRRAALDAREECYAKIERVEQEKWALRDSLVSEEREVEVLRAHLKRLKDATDKAAVSAESDYRAACHELEAERGHRQRLQDKTELLEGKASLLEERLSALSEQIDRYKTEALQQQQDKDRLLRSQETLQSQLKEEVQSVEKARREFLSNSQEISRGRDKERELEEQRDSAAAEAARLTCLLEEERRARREENAMGEAVLREVRETQGLLGEMSPHRGDPAGTGPFRGSVLERGSSSDGDDPSSALGLQASKLERIVAEASDLIRRTGHFYDRYSETHKNAGGEKNGDDEASEKLPGSNSGLPGNDATAGRYQNRGAATGAGQSDRYEGRHRAASAEAAIERSFGANGRSPGDPPPGVFSPQQPPAGGGHQPWRGREDSWNFLDRTLEHRHWVETGPALRELDRACYSLLESNAQLCLRIQGLGLEYAGLTRELMASGGGEHCFSKGYRLVHPPRNGAASINISSGQKPARWQETVMITMNMSENSHHALSTHGYSDPSAA